MVAAIPLTVCTARNSPPTGARFAGLRSHSSSSWLQALRCSRLSARNSSAYCERSMESAEDARSEEHTSELQSQSNLVCRLLLEKKKKNKKHNREQQTYTMIHTLSHVPLRQMQY